MSDEMKNNGSGENLEIEDLYSDDTKEEVKAAVPEETKPEEKEPENKEPEKAEEKTGQEDVKPENPEEPSPVKKSGKKAVLIVCGCIAAALVCAFLWYYTASQKYKTEFFPNTTVNGIDVSGITAKEAEKKVNTQINDYILTVSARDQKDETITGKEIGMKYVFGDYFENLIAAQKPLHWISHEKNQNDFTVDTLISVDDEKFKTAVSKLSCMDTSKFSTPADAYVSEYKDGTGYSVIPEKKGNVLDTEKAAAEIKKAALELSEHIDLDAKDSGLYKKPAVLSDDATLNTTCRNLNMYVTTEIDYQDGKEIVLNGSTVKDWLTMGKDLSVSVDSNAVAAWVKNLASQYDTVYKAKKLHTSWGTDVTVSGGSYGWRVDQKAETAYVLATLPTGQKVKRSPEYSRTAASHGENDFGNTYVEVNLTAQHLYYYKNGSVVVSSDFVSGCTSKGRGTPTGIYQVAYKQKHAILKGQGYASPVDYWMPFNMGVGLHDASWRNTFGGNIYVTNGSHGCINLPHSAAETIYANIEAGCPVLVYNMDGSASGPTTDSAKVEQQETPETTPDTVTETTKAAESTQAGETVKATVAETSSAAAETTAQPSGPVATSAATVSAKTSEASEDTEKETAAGPGVKSTTKSTDTPATVSGGPGV